MCIHCKKAGVIDAVATTFDGVKAIRQAVADYKRHISTTSKKALKENKDYGDDTGAKKAEKSIAVMNDVSEKFIYCNPRAGQLDGENRTPQFVS